MNVEAIVGSILNQAPDNTTEEQIKELIIKYDGDETEILLKLWNIPEKIIKNVDYNDNIVEKNKWKNIREICDAHDEEMTRYMDAIKSRQINKTNSLDNIPEQATYNPDIPETI